MSPTIVLAGLFFGYLLGSIPFGKMIATSQGVDIQSRGSGNIGFANVRRVLGWKAGLLTLLGDILKGFIPALLTLNLTENETFAFLTGLAAIFGHIFSVWLRFKGGKGIATGLGLVIVLNPLAALAGSSIYVAASMLFKRSSTGSILGVVTVLLVASIQSPEYAWQYALLLGLSFWTLRHNLAGTVPNYDT